MHAGSVLQSNFTSNNATYDGGAIYVSEYAHVNITDSILTANEVQRRGGALGLAMSAHCLGLNTVFAHNRAQDWGGAIMLIGDSKLMLASTCRYAQPLGAAQ